MSPQSESSPASTFTPPIIINRLNDAELASEPLKAGAVKLHAFLGEPLPDLVAIKKERDRLPVLEAWQQLASTAVRQFLKANGGKFHDEFRELWMTAFLKCEQSTVDAARQWLTEQFKIGIEPVESANQEPQGVAIATDHGNNPSTSNEIDEHPATTDAQVGAASGDPLAAVESVPEDQKPDYRRNRRGNRKSTGDGG